MSLTAWAFIAYILFVLVATFAPRMGGREMDKTPALVYFFGSVVLFPLVGLIPGCSFFLLPFRAVWQLVG